MSAPEHEPIGAIALATIMAKLGRKSSKFCGTVKTIKVDSQCTHKGPRRSAWI
jgi:hypothetical protein